MLKILIIIIVCLILGFSIGSFGMSSFITGDPMLLFDNSRFKCACTKAMEMSQAPNLTTLYPSAFDAGAAMHQCGKPKQYMYDNSLYALQSTGKYTRVVEDSS